MDRRTLFNAALAKMLGGLTVEEKVCMLEECLRADMEIVFQDVPDDKLKHSLELALGEDLWMH